MQLVISGESIEVTFSDLEGLVSGVNFFIPFHSSKYALSLEYIH